MENKEVLSVLIEMICEGAYNDAFNNKTIPTDMTLDEYMEKMTDHAKAKVLNMFPQKVKLSDGESSLVKFRFKEVKTTTDYIVRLLKVPGGTIYLIFSDHAEVGIPVASHFLSD